MTEGPADGSESSDGEDDAFFIPEFGAWYANARAQAGEQGDLSQEPVVVEDQEELDMLMGIAEEALRRPRAAPGRVVPA
jgi:hypothetical protein